MTKIQQQAQDAVNSLNKSVHDVLDRKKRLGHYAVIWQDGKIVHLFKEGGRGSANSGKK